METTENISEPRRLTRPREGRWLGGVCAGLTRYFDLSPLIYRIAFVALALAGGTGVLLYVAAWLVIPDEDAEDSIAAEAIRRHRERPWLLVGVGLLAFAGVLALSEARIWPSPGNVWLAAALAGGAIVWWHVRTRRPVAVSVDGDVSPPARRRSLLPLATGVLIVGFGIAGLLDALGAWSVDWRIVLAASAVVLGALVAAGAAAGRAVAAVVVLGLAVLVALTLALAIRVPVFAGVGDRVEQPATAAALDSRYTLGIGNFEVDLSAVALPAGRTHVKATLGIGGLVVHVPRDATVEVDGRASAGKVVLFGRKDSGTGVHEHTIDARPAGAPVLVLDARVGLGNLEVERG
jgi:phage shock protein PspC (stress-responsive transcriptional regulator)